MEPKQTIHPVYTDGSTPLYFIVPGDGTRSYCLGERWELEAIRDKLTAILERDQHDGILSESAEKLGDWLTVKQAALLMGISQKTIRNALNAERIEGAKKKPLRMSRFALRRYRDTYRPRRTKVK